MPEYNVYPAVDENSNFPPSVRKATAKSPEIKAELDLVKTEIDSSVTTQVKEVTNYSAEVSRAAVRFSDAIAGNDSRISQTVESSDYVYSFADEDGYATAGFYADGTFNTQLPPAINGVRGLYAQPINSLDWNYVETDEDGYVAFGVRKDGSIHISKQVAFTPPGVNEAEALSVANKAIGYTRSNRNRIACFGDSLTNGYFDGASGKTADSYPTKLQALVPANVQVFNASTSGWCVDEVAVKIGAIPLPLTFPNNTIPAAAGASKVTTNANLSGLRALGTSVYFNGTINGVAGTLTRSTSNTELSFSRKTAGVAVSVTPNTIFIPEHAGYDADTSVIFLGRNDVSLGIKGSENSVAEHIAAGVQRIIDWHTRQLKQILVLSPTTNTGEVKGTAGYTSIVTAGEILKSNNPTKYYDLRQYLVTKAIYDLNITPTETDLTKMAGDTLPPSIMDPGDGTHYSRATAALVAARVNEALTQRDWIG